MQVRDILTFVMCVALIGIAFQQYTLSENVVSNSDNRVVIEHLAKLDAAIEEIKAASLMLEDEAAEENVAKPQTEMGEVFASPEVSGELNELKSRFEGLFVNYQYLKGCGVVDESSYHILNSALVHELASNDAPARLQYDILTAAQGTYEEIYARSECDAVSLEQIKNGFENYLQDAQKVGFVIKD